MTSSEFQSWIANQIWLFFSPAWINSRRVVSSLQPEKNQSSKTTLITLYWSRASTFTQNWFVLLSSEFVRLNHPSDSFLYCSSVCERPVFGVKWLSPPRSRKAARLWAHRESFIRPGHKQVSVGTEPLSLCELLCWWFKGGNDAIHSDLRWRGSSVIHTAPSLLFVLVLSPSQEGNSEKSCCCSGPKKLFRPKGPAQPQAALWLLLLPPHCKNTWPRTLLPNCTSQISSLGLPNLGAC